MDRAYSLDITADSQTSSSFLAIYMYPYISRQPMGNNQNNSWVPITHGYPHPRVPKDNPRVLTTRGYPGITHGYMLFLKLGKVYTRVTRAAWHGGRHQQCVLQNHVNRNAGHLTVRLENLNHSQQACHEGVTG